MNTPRHSDNYGDYPTAPGTSGFSRKNRGWVPTVLITAVAFGVGGIIGIAAGPERKAPIYVPPAPITVTTGPTVSAPATWTTTAPKAQPAVEPTKPKTDVIVFSDPRVFGDAYDKNKVAADKKYRDRKIQITATLTNVNDDNLTFGKVTTDDFSLTQISCRLQNEGQAEVVENGKKYTITGIVSGQNFGVIGLDDCAVK